MYQVYHNAEMSATSQEIMPVGRHIDCAVSPATTSELVPPLVEGEGGGGGGGGGEVVVEGGRGSWEETKPKSGRRKRKSQTNHLLDQKVQEETNQQVYTGTDIETEIEETPANYLNLDISSSSIKRQCLDGYTGHLDQQQGHYQDALTNDSGTVDHPDDHAYLQASGSNDGAEQTTGGRKEVEEEEVEVEEAVREDILSIMREQQTKIQDLLSKCEGALNEGMAYEALFPLRIDEMLRATRELEQSLIDQKQAMKDRLQQILGLL